MRTTVTLSLSMFMPRASCHPLRLSIMPYVSPIIHPEENNEQHIVLAIKQHIANGPASLSLDDLSEALGISKKRISSIFRKQLGVSVAQFMRDERMRRAQRLLVQTSLDIRMIAQALGYSSSANFSNAFRDHIGMSPSVFRETAPMTSITALQGSMKWSSTDP
ncbi:helix-turn-helix transcriptional regulator [Pollutimonas harenae]|uniref:Helix-turn-helix transcriptional regulator n=1 Tax=Pollutimonas harenae TaxID=657015 RepID=A0A853H728_9BURK|nr:helix-turn-helix transcriptional regulator [Pollutimonas harenae]NYT85904.1 helix-turn-helix transcriptional regulator [Pollutimonas harenae]TEA70957.1 AraC family transcriptional regulator [Pollutimonas harenae]